MHQDDKEKTRSYYRKKVEELGDPPQLIWADEAEAHWAEFLPEWTKYLKDAGAFQDAVILAQEQAKEMAGQMVEDGVDPFAVREIVMKQFLYLDPEPTPEEIEEMELNKSPLDRLIEEY